MQSAHAGTGAPEDELVEEEGAPLDEELLVVLEDVVAPPLEDEALLDELLA
ncbi:MAG: hypothetical protein AB2A00_23560 [Myxococcota bacterium]